MMYHYCERLGPGFWAEPVNAVSNLAFVVAAGFLYRHLRQARVPLRKVPDILSLIVLLCIITVGSFLWHTLAIPWTEWADVTPILIYISLYLLSFLIRLARQARLKVFGLFVLYQAVNIGLQLRFPPHLLNGSMFYLPTLATLILMGIYCQRVRHPAANRMLLAGVVFGISLAFRTLDFTLCPVWPLGTHFIWHILNAYVLYLITQALIDSTRRSGGRRQGIT